MEENQRRALLKLFHILAEQVDPVSVPLYLYTKGLLHRTHYQLICNEPTDVDKRIKLLEIIQDRDHGWQEFCDALVDSHQKYLRDQLEQQLNDIRQNCSRFETKLKVDNSTEEIHLSPEQCKFQQWLIEYNRNMLTRIVEKSSFLWVFKPVTHYFEEIFQQLEFYKKFANGTEEKLDGDCANSYYYLEENYSRITLIEGEPGSGKSTYVAKLLHDWVNGHPLLRKKFAFVFLLHCADLRLNQDNQSFEDCLRQLMMHNSDDYHLFPNIIKSTKTLIIFDGFDENPSPEIYDLIKNEIINVKNMEQQGIYTTSTYTLLARIIITTRPTYVNAKISRSEATDETPTVGSLNLRKLCNMSLKIEGFSDNSLNKYLSKLIEDPDDSMKLLHVLKTQNNDFLRNPFYAAMLCAIGTKEQITVISEAENQFKLKLMFDKFSEHHKKHIMQQKSPKQASAVISEEIYEKSIAEAKKLAAIICFRHIKGISLPTYQSLNEDYFKNLCLTVSCRDTTSTYDFIHRVFAEYYAAAWLAENMDQLPQRVIEKLYCNSSPEVIYFLIGHDIECLISYLKINSIIYPIPVKFVSLVSDINKHVNNSLQFYDWNIDSHNVFTLLALDIVEDISMSRCTITTTLEFDHGSKQCNIKELSFDQCQLHASVIFTILSAQNIQNVSLNQTRIIDCGGTPAIYGNNVQSMPNIVIEGQHGAENVNMISNLMQTKAHKQNTDKIRKNIRLEGFSISADDLIRFITLATATHDIVLGSDLAIITQRFDSNAISNVYPNIAINSIKFELCDADADNFAAAEFIIKAIRLRKLIIKDFTSKQKSEASFDGKALHMLLKTPFGQQSNLAQTLELLKVYLKFHNFNSFLETIQTDIQGNTKFKLILKIADSDLFKHCKRIESIQVFNANRFSSEGYVCLSQLFSAGSDKFELHADGPCLTLLKKKLHYLIENSTLSDTDANRIVELCIEIYEKHQSTKDYHTIANEIVAQSIKMQPYCAVKDVQVCFIYRSNLSLIRATSPALFFKVLFPHESVMIEIYKFRAAFLEQDTTKEDLQQLIEATVNSDDLLNDSMAASFFQVFTIVDRPVNNDWAVASESHYHCKAYEVEVENYTMTFVRLIREQFVTVVTNQLAANAELIPQIIEDLAEIYYMPTEYNEFVDAILSHVSILEPYISSQNPIKCIIYKGESLTNCRSGTQLCMSIGDAILELFQDVSGQPSEAELDSASKFDIDTWLYVFVEYETGKIKETVINPLNAKFTTFHWNSVVVSENVDDFAIASIPQNVPIFEASGRNGERILIWPIEKIISIKRTSVKYEVKTSRVSSDELEQIIELCVEIYENHRLTKNFSAIANEIAGKACQKKPYCDLGGLQICCVYQSHIGLSRSELIGTFVHVYFPDDDVNITLHKLATIFIEQLPPLELQELIGILAGDHIKILKYFMELGGDCVIVDAPINNEWALACESPYNSQTHEIIFSENSCITVMYCIRKKLSTIVQNQLVASRDLIPQIVEEVAEKYFELQEFNKIAESVLSKVSAMEPYISSQNPLRCIIYKGDVHVTGKADSYLWMNVGDVEFKLFQDENVQASDCKLYNGTLVQEYLTELSADYKFPTTTYKAIIEPLSAKFQNIRWNGVILWNEINKCVLATLPSNLTQFEAQGSNGERIIVWPPETPPSMRTIASKGIVEKSDLSAAEEKQILELCTEIYGSTKDLSVIAKEVIAKTSSMHPYCDIAGVQICCIYHNLITLSQTRLPKTFIEICFPYDSIKLKLYKMSPVFLEQPPTELELQQHLEPFAHDKGKILSFFVANFGRDCTIVHATINNEWAFACDSPKQCKTYEIKFSNDQSDTIIQFIRENLVAVIKNDLTTNREKISQIVEEIADKYYKSREFNKVVEGALNAVSTMEPYINSQNPIRCLIYQGNVHMNVKAESHLWMIVGDVEFRLFQDENVQPSDCEPYKHVVIQSYLQKLSEKYEWTMNLSVAVIEPLNAKFNKFRWNGFVHVNHFSVFAIRSLPHDFPLFQAEGPKGEKIFVWPLTKQADMKTKYEIMRNDLSDFYARQIINICTEIFESGQQTGAFSNVANEILARSCSLQPYSKSEGVLVCCIYRSNITASSSKIFPTFIRIYLPRLDIYIELFELKTTFFKRTQQELQEHLKTLPYDTAQLRLSLDNAFGDGWIVVNAPVNNDWAFACDVPSNCHKNKLKLTENQAITVLQCTRIKLTEVRMNELTANQELIPQMIERLAQKYAVAKKFNKIAQELLNTVAKMEPYCSTNNPIRCIIYKGKQLLHRKTGTLLSMSIDDYKLHLYQDEFGGSNISYNETEIQEYLQQLVESHNSAESAFRTISDSLSEKFSKVYWSSIIIPKNVDEFAIESQPPTLLIIEARGINGERIFAWPSVKPSNFQVMQSNLSKTDTEQIINICTEIYEKHKSTTDFQMIAQEIVAKSRTVKPYIDFGGIQVCCIFRNNRTLYRNCMPGTCVSIFLPVDDVNIVLYKIVSEFLEQESITAEVQQCLSEDWNNICEALIKEIGFYWTVVDDVTNSEWKFACEFPELCRTYELRLKNGQPVTAIKCLQRELVSVEANKLSTNWKLIPQIIKEIVQQYFKSNEFERIAADVLNRVTQMDPYRISQNPVRCFISKGVPLVSLCDKPGTLLTMSVGNYYLELFQDKFSQSNYSYNVTETQKNLQTLADAYTTVVEAKEFIADPFVAKYSKFNWYIKIIYSVSSESAFATKPPDLPAFEAQAPNGERILAWPMGSSDS